MRNSQLIRNAILAVLMAILAGCQSPANNDVVDAYGDKDYVGAIRLSEKHIQDGNDTKVDRILHAWALFQLGYLHKAQTEFNQLTHNNPESFHGWLGQAWVLMKQRRFKQVPGKLAQAERWMAQHQRPMLYAARAWLAFYTGDIDTASALFDKTEASLYFEDAAYIHIPASIMDTWNTLPWVGRGWIALARRKPEQAQRMFQRGIDHDDSCHLCYAGLAQTALAGGDLDKAISLAQKGLAVSRHDPELTATLNRLLWKKNDPKLSLDIYTKLVEQSRNDPLYLANLGYLYLYRGQQTKARQSFEAALAEEKGLRLAKVGLATLANRKPPREKEMKKAGTTPASRL